MNEKYDLLGQNLSLVTWLLGRDWRDTQRNISSISCLLASAVSLCRPRFSLLSLLAAAAACSSSELEPGSRNLCGEAALAEAAGGAEVGATTGSFSAQMSRICSSLRSLALPSLSLALPSLSPVSSVSPLVPGWSVPHSGIPAG